MGGIEELIGEHKQGGERMAILELSYVKSGDTFPQVCYHVIMNVDMSRIFELIPFCIVQVLGE